jgi:hypothetical protein
LDAPHNNALIAGLDHGNRTLFAFDCGKE